MPNMDSIRLKTKELQSKMYMTQPQRLRLIDSDSLTHWTDKSGQLYISTSKTFYANNKMLFKTVW